MVAMSGQEIVLNGRYQLLERIGSGGMSIVYKAQDRALGRLVAIKMLHESLTGDPDFLLRFQQEAYAAANLTHPNIVTVHDIGQDGQRHFIVMEYVDGQTLKQLIRQYNEEERLMPLDRVLDLSVQICSGIGYAHRANLVHCDVKPQNVMITRDDRVKVADFGIARAVSEASQQYQDSQIWGTPQYFSPEQAAGKAATPASDVYSIGIMMFEMLTGALPFQAQSQTALALKHLQEKPPLVGDLNPAIPERLELIVDKVLSKEPSGRYRTAGQLGQVLTTYRKTSMEETGAFSPVITEAPTQVDIPVTQQRTQIYRRPDLEVERGESRIATDEMKTEVAIGVPLDGETYYPSLAQPATDWTAVALGIVAVLALLGLIPLWYFVWLAYAG